MSKVTELADLQTPASGDLLPIIDVSDTSMAGTGTNKKITVGDLLGDYTTSADLQTALVPGTGIKINGATSGLSVSLLEESFESIAKNIKSYPFANTFTDGLLTSVVYTLPSGTITKTVNYASGRVSSIVLSGATPIGIDLTKTINYSDGVVSSVSYS